MHSSLSRAGAWPGMALQKVYMQSVKCTGKEWLNVAHTGVRKWSLSTLTTLALLIAPVTAQSDGITRVEMLVCTCFNCHGPGGRGSGRIPELRDLDASDVRESLYGFRTGEEKSTIMQHHAKGLTEEEIQLIADYFGALE